MRTVPDEDTEINLLRTHAIDYIFEASVEKYPALRTLPDARIVWVNVNGYSYIQFNLARPFLADPRVRLALAYAIDKNELVRTLAFGTQTVATEDIPDWMWAFNPRVHSHAHDPAQARTLLREAGWRPGPDGIMRKNGQALSLVLVTNNSSTTRRREALEVQAMLRQAGVDTEIKSYPADVLYAPAGMGGIFQLGRFDLNLSGWYAGIDPDDSTQFTCENFPPGGYNYSRYCNPNMQAAQKIALNELRPRRAHRRVLPDTGTPGARQSVHLRLLAAADGADQRRLQGLRSKSGRRVVERVAMDHLGFGELTWLRKIIAERALTRGDYVLCGRRAQRLLHR